VKLFTDAEAETYTREDLFGLISAAFARGDELAPESQLYLEHKHQEFVKNGFEIAAGPKRDRFVEIKRRIQQLELDYRKCLNASSGIWFTPQELDVLPSHVLEGLKTGEGENAGKLCLPLRKPHLELAMKFLKSELTRKRVYVGYGNSCLDK
jgi:metallopeptidase MepB